MAWGSDVEREIHVRIKVSIYAYAYEFDNTSLVPDAHFDALAGCVRPQLATGDAQLDEFFRSEFSPSTGMWIHQHPQLEKIKHLYEQHYMNRFKGISEGVAASFLAGLKGIQPPEGHWKIVDDKLVLRNAKGEEFEWSFEAGDPISEVLIDFLNHLPAFVVAARG